MLTWRKLTGRRKEGDTDKDAATRAKKTESEHKEHDDDEQAAKRAKIKRNQDALKENDKTEADRAAREKYNEYHKLAARRRVQEQRAAFQKKTNRLLASLPLELRRLCL